MSPIIGDSTTPTSNFRTLGCSSHVAYIQGKCNGPRMCELLNVTHLGYDRRLDDISDAFVEVSISGDSDNPCCACLGDVEPWCHVLTIMREGDGVVWTGPVQKVTYGYNMVRIDARDKLAWLTVRVDAEAVHQFNGLPPVLPLTYAVSTVPYTTVAKNVIRTGMANDGDSPCFMGTDDCPDCGVLDLGDGRPADENRAIDFPYFGGPTVFDDLTTIANCGIDYTVIAGCLILGSAELPAEAIGVLLDEHILGDINIIKDGSLLVNAIYVRYATDTNINVCNQIDPSTGLFINPCPAFEDTDTQCYGLIEKLIPDGGGVPNSDVARNVAFATLAAAKTIPRRIEFQAGTRLSPDTPWELNDMIPGQRIDVALTKLCVPVFQSFKLQQVTVEDTGAEETISIDLKALDVN